MVIQEQLTFGFHFLGWDQWNYVYLIIININMLGGFVCPLYCFFSETSNLHVLF